MSLLLDALNRASKEKHKAAAAPSGAPAESLQWEPLPATVPEAPAAQAPPQPPAEPPAPPRPSAPDTWELSLAPQAEPASPAASTPAVAEPVMEPVAPPAPMPAAAAEPVLPAAEAVPAPAPVHSTAGIMDPPARPAAVEPTLQAAAPVRPVQAPAASPPAAPTEPPSQVAQDILRATAPPPAMAASGRRRVWMLGGLAAGLALVLGVFFSGLLGDPGQWLGLGTSSLGTPTGVAAVPDTAEAPPPPETPVASADAVAVASAPASAPEPLPTASASAPVVIPPVAAAKPVQAAAPQPGARPPAGAPPVRSVPKPSASTDTPAPAPAVPLRAGGLPRSAVATSTRVPGQLEKGYAALLDARFDVAETAYREALRTNPQERDALLGLAYIRQQQGQREAAQAYYREVLRQEPGNAIAVAGLQSLDARPDSTAFNPVADGVAAGSTESAAAMAAAGSTLVREGRLADAAQAFARAQALEPANPLHAYNHAVAQDRLGRHAAALRLYETVLQLDSAAPAAQRGYQLDTVRSRAQQLRAALDSTAREIP